jgi:heptosyltransferase-3
MTSAGRIEIGTSPRILVIALRRLGDVLLTTPLIRSLRRAWPSAHIDALVFADTAGILAGNPDLNSVITMPARPSPRQSLALGLHLFRRYDLGVSSQSGDRPIGFAVAAGRQSVAPVNARLNGRVKRALLNRSIAVAKDVHRVEEMLRIVDALGIARVADVVPPSARAVEGLPASDYAVIHAAPMFRYKQWTKSGWRALAEALMARGLAVVATGGPAEDERLYLDDVWDGVKVTRLDGRLDWAQLTGLLGKARVYIGPDTSVTHLAAAAGCPTVALYGPTDPRLWAPWPARGLDQPWDAAGKIQQRGNVWLVQHAFPCTPCQLEGCERRLASYSACLDALELRQVIAAVDQALISVGHSNMAAGI